MNVRAWDAYLSLAKDIARQREVCVSLKSTEDICRRVDAMRTICAQLRSIEESRVGVQSKRSQLAAWPEYSAFGVRLRKKNAAGYAALADNVRVAQSQLDEKCAAEPRLKLQYCDLAASVGIPDSCSLEEALAIAVERKTQAAAARQQEWDTLKRLKRQLVDRSIDAYGLHEAKELFGDLLYGPAHVFVQETRHELLCGPMCGATPKAYSPFGSIVEPSALPALPDARKIDAARELGMVLALRVYGDARAPAWKLFSTSPVPGTINVPYVRQTQAVRDFLKTRGLLADDEADACSDAVLNEISAIGQRSRAEASARLTSLLVNVRHRHSAEDVCYFNTLLQPILPSDRPSLRNNDYESTHDLSPSGASYGTACVCRFGDYRGVHLLDFGYGLTHPFSDNTNNHGVRIVL